MIKMQILFVKYHNIDIPPNSQSQAMRASAISIQSFMANSVCAAPSERWESKQKKNLIIAHIFEHVTMFYFEMQESIFDRTDEEWK